MPNMRSIWDATTHVYTGVISKPGEYLTKIVRINMETSEYRKIINFTFLTEYGKIYIFPYEIKSTTLRKYLSLLKSLKVPESNELIIDIDDPRKNAQEILVHAIENLLYKQCKITLAVNIYISDDKYTVLDLKKIELFTERPLIFENNKLKPEDLSTETLF